MLKISPITFLVIYALFGMAPAGWSKDPSRLERDPFWPVNWTPSSRNAPKTEPNRQLTDEELLELARNEQDRIKHMIEIKGTIQQGSKYFLYINDQFFVTEGDVLELAVGGTRYQLLIRSLTKDNIRLEPYRRNAAP